MTSRRKQSSSLEVRLARAARHWTTELGPGVVTGAADDDPSGIATYSQAGAQFGYGLLWTIPLSYPLLAAVQLISAHIGRVTGGGLAKTFSERFPRPLVGVLIAFLLTANIFNIGADLAAMAASARLAVGGGEHFFVWAFALLCVGLQVFMPYRQYAKALKWLTLSLFAYAAVLLFVHVDWRAALVGFVWPTNLGRSALLTIVAIFGTTISPYLFFWQSAQEAEEVAVHRHQKPLLKAPKQALRQLRRIRDDTLVGMLFAHVIALAIMLATAATLNAHGITNIGSAADAAEALRPIAGRFAFGMFALGIIGTGLLAVPVLAGSAAFAVSEVLGWRRGLEYKPRQAMRFYAVIVAATLIGVILDWSAIDPMKALFWAAVINGVSAVPIMAAMMMVASQPEIMGRFTERPMVLILGWITTGIMAVACAVTLLDFLSS